MKRLTDHFRTVAVLSMMLFAAVISGADAAADRTPRKVRPDKIRLDFTGQPKPGEAFRFSVRSTQTEYYEMKVVGLERPPARRDVTEIRAEGTLRYVKKTDSGVGPVPERVFELTLDSLSGENGGKRLEFPELTGRTVRIVTGPTATQCRLIPDPTARRDAASANVLGGSGSGAAGNDLPPGAEVLLKKLFPAVQDSPETYLGKTQKLHPGQKFPLNLSPLLDVLQARGIAADADHIEGFAEYAGQDVFFGIPINRVNVVAQGRHIPGYDFKLELTLLLPANGTSSGPIRISRRAMEVTDAYLPENNPLYAGAGFEIVNNNLTDMFLIPLSLLPEKKPETPQKKRFPLF